MVARFRSVVANGMDLGSTEEGTLAGFDDGLDVRGVREREEGTCPGFQWLTQDTRAPAEGRGSPSRWRTCSGGEIWGLPVSGLWKRWVRVCDPEAKGRAQEAAGTVMTQTPESPAQVPVPAPPLFLLADRRQLSPENLRR